MTTIQTLESLSEAVRILRKFRVQNAEVQPVWAKLNSAGTYLEKQVAALLADPEVTQQ